MLEICTFSVEAAMEAQKAGAERLELCVNYSVGGLTPGRPDLPLLRDKIHIPSVIMLRPKPGDFIYNNKEKDDMLQEVQFIRSLGFDGIVFGALNEENALDEAFIKQVIDAGQGLEIVFHRAFDDTPNHFESAQNLAQWGVHRILSATWRTHGLEYVRDLQAQAGCGLEMMPVSGVRASNIKSIKEAGFSEIHSSALPDPDKSQIPDTNEIKLMLDILYS